MKWQCALLQRWLPEYPDGDLPAWGKRWLKSHLARCAACRQELSGLREVVAAMGATTMAEPGPEFWLEFSRDLHLKLVQAAHNAVAAPAPAAAGPRRFRLPYLLGAPVLAGLLLYVAVHLTGTGAPIQEQVMLKRETVDKMAAVPRKAPSPPASPKMAEVARQSPAPPAAPQIAAKAKIPPAATPDEVPGAPASPLEQFVTVALEEGAPLPVEEVEISEWDLDAELAGMSDQEKDVFLNQLHQRKKDGSCVVGFSYCSWG